jgi:hypothetical protein
MSFFMHHHSPDNDLLVVAAGTPPKYVLWAQDLELGAVTTWPARYAGAGASASLVGGVIVSDGYNNRKAVELDGGDYVNLDSILGSFQAGQERTVFLALTLTEEAAARCVLSDSQSSGSTSTMVKFTLDSSDFATVTKSGGVSSPTTAIPESTPLILVIRSNGTAVTVFRRKRGITTTILTETLAETTNVHNQHTLFAHRFQTTVTQYTTGSIRLAMEFAAPLDNTHVEDVLEYVESASGLDCPTIEEPELLLAAELGVFPHIFFYGPDAVVGTSPETVRNRGVGVDLVNTPLVSTRIPVVSSYDNIPAFSMRGAGYLDASESIDMNWGGYGTAEVIVLAFQYSDSFSNNRRLIDYESVAVNVSTVPYRALETITAGADIRNYHVVGDGTAQEVVTPNTPLRPNTRYIVIYSRSAAGAAKMLVRSRTLLGAFNEVYSTGTQSTSIPTAITGVFFGGVNRPVSGGKFASDIGDMVLGAVFRDTELLAQSDFQSIANLIESDSGLNLPMGTQVNQLVSAPQVASLKVWYSGRLQSTSISVAVDDLSPSGSDGIPTGISLANEILDFGSNAINKILPTPSLSIPSGTGSLACVAIVMRKAGLSWTSSDSYNVASGSNTTSAAFYFTGSEVKVLWNATQISSNYNFLGWAVGDIHVVAFGYDGTNLRFYIDDMTTPVRTVAPGVARSGSSALLIGSFNSLLGWQGHMRSIQYWIGASLSGAGEMQQAVMSQMGQLMHIYATGDSNSDANVAVAPAGASVWWYQLITKMRAQGYTAAFEYNDAVSGSTWNNATPIAPTPILARGAALDARTNPNVINVLIVGSHSTNDFNYSNLSVATVQGHVTAYCTARIAAGCWHKIIFVQTIPQTRNATNDAKIDSLNAWLVTQVGILFDELVVLDAALQDSTDTATFLPNSSSTIAEHLNATGSGILADQMIDTMQDMNWNTTL